MIIIFYIYLQARLHFLIALSFYRCLALDPLMSRHLILLRLYFNDVRFAVLVRDTLLSVLISECHSLYPVLVMMVMVTRVILIIVIVSCVVVVIPAHKRRVVVQRGRLSATRASTQARLASLLRIAIAHAKVAASWPRKVVVAVSATVELRVVRKALALLVLCYKHRVHY